MEAELFIKNKSLLDSIADKLLISQQELDELALQLALGKAEVKDKFEEVKADFKLKLDEFNFSMNGRILGMAGERWQAHVEDLDEFLLGDVVLNYNAFKKQVDDIVNSVQALKLEIKEKLPSSFDVQYFQYEIDKFILKLDILGLRFKLTSMKLHDEFYDRLSDARDCIRAIRTLSIGKIEAEVEDFTIFKNKVEEVFGYWKKAIKSIA